MKKSIVSKEVLKKYCEDHDICVYSRASREELEASIARAYYHLQKVSPNVHIGCFGFWEDDDLDCQCCDFEKDCFEASLGMTKDRHIRMIKKLENPKIRYERKFKKK